MLSNTFLLDDCTMLRPVPRIVAGTDISNLHIELRDVVLPNGRTIDAQSDAILEEPFGEAFFEGGRLPPIANIRLAAPDDPTPKGPMFAWNFARIVRDDVFRLFQPAFEVIGQVFACEYVTNTGKAKSGWRYHYVQVTERYHFSEAMSEAMVERAPDGPLVLRAEMNVRNDTPGNGRDIFPTFLDDLPELFFAGNYLKLAHPIVKREALGKLGDLASEFIDLGIPRTRSREHGIRIPREFEDWGRQA